MDTLTDTTDKTDTIDTTDTIHPTDTSAKAAVPAGNAAEPTAAASADLLWQAARSAVPLVGFRDVKKYLHALYEWKKAQLASYSYLQYSADLGLSKSNVIRLVINGQRPFTAKAAARVAAALGIEGSDLRYFEGLVRIETAAGPAAREAARAELTTLKARREHAQIGADQYNFFGHWYYPVIAEMMSGAEFRSDPYWIAEQTMPRIQPEQAKKALEVLEKLGLAKFDNERGRHYPTNSSLSTGDMVKSADLVRYYEKMIDLGREAIARVHPEQRDISSLTACVSEEVAVQIRDEINQVRERITALATASTQHERVYQLNFQFFPVTQPYQDGED